MTPWWQHLRNQTTKESRCQRWPSGQGTSAWPAESGGHGPCSCPPWKTWPSWPWASEARAGRPSTWNSRMRCHRRSRWAATHLHCQKGTKVQSRREEEGTGQRGRTLGVRIVVHGLGLGLGLVLGLLGLGPLGSGLGLGLLDRSLLDRTVRGVLVIGVSLGTATVSREDHGWIGRASESHGDNHNVLRNYAIVENIHTLQSMRNYIVYIADTMRAGDRLFPQRISAVTHPKRQRSDKLTARRTMPPKA